MSSARSQNVEKKHGKAFDFKWFQRGLKPPPQDCLIMDGNETKNTSKNTSTSKTTGSSLSHARNVSVAPNSAKSTPSPSRAASFRSSTLGQARSRSVSRPASRSVSATNLTSRSEASSKHGSYVSGMHISTSHGMANTNGANNNLSNGIGSNNGSSGTASSGAGSGSGDVLRRKLDRLLLGEHSRGASDLAANSIQFPLRQSRPSVSSRSTRSSSRGSSNELSRESSNGPGPGSNGSNYNGSHNNGSNNNGSGSNGSGSNNGSSNGSISDNPTNTSHGLFVNASPRGNSSESHFGRSFLLETQDFWNRRRKTDDSRTRSRSSSLARSLRRPSEASTSTVPLGTSLTSDGNGSNSLYPGSAAHGSTLSVNGTGPPSFASFGSEQDPVWLKRTLPLQPPPTIGLGSVLEDRDVIALRLDPMAVRYADHMHMLGYTQNRYVCAMLAEEVKPKEGRTYNSMVIQAFIMRMLRFHGEPLDMSLRKFLFRVALPQESQQIERVLYSFSRLWSYHNPGLFVDDDQVLCAVFSLLMLHTDAFNRNVKRKMSKPDYVRNAALDGIAPEIFGYFYDNITAVPFRADDDVPSANSPSFLFSDSPVTPANSASFPDSTTASPVGGTPDSNNPSYSTPQRGRTLAHTTHTASTLSAPPHSASTNAAHLSPDVSPPLPTTTVPSAQNIQEEGDDTTTPDGDVTLSVSPATPIVAPVNSTSAMFPSAQQSSRGPPASPLGSPNLLLPRPPAPSTPTSGGMSAFGASPNYPSVPPEEPSRDTNSMGSRRSSSFTWLRDQPLDPYPYLLENRLDALRPELSGVPATPELDIKAFTCSDDLRTVQSQLCAQHTDTLQIVLPRSRSEIYVEAPNAPNEQKLEAQARPGIVSVEIVKFGSLFRREWKRTFVGLRPGWREWGVLLTTSRLYLFKNASIVRQLESNRNNKTENSETTTSIGTLQSASVLSTSNIAAVVVTHSHHEDENFLFFKLVESDSRSPTQHHFAVRSEAELKEWIQMINVVATQSTLHVSIEPLSIPRDISRAQAKVAEQIEAIQSRIDSLSMNLRHFQLLAPLHQRTRESLVFTAGGYSSKCEDAQSELTRLRVYENVLSYALVLAKEGERVEVR